MGTLSDAYNRVCCTPSDIQEPLPTLASLAKQCNHATEFGVRCGNSSIALLTGLASAPGRSDRAYAGYDLKAAPPELERLALDNGIRYQHNIDDTMRVKAIAETDLLFLDTRHDADHVRRELVHAHNGAVSRYVVLHDTETYGWQGQSVDGKPTAGILLAVGEFLVKNHEWRVCRHYRNNNGLTVLERF